MPRPKGSKNKTVRRTQNESLTFFQDQIRKLQTERDAIGEKIAALSASVDAQKKELLAAKRKQKKISSEISSLNVRQKEMEEQEAAREKQAEVQKLVSDFLAGGKTVDDLVSLLKTE